jgi:hypothetical protein
MSETTVTLRARVRPRWRWYVFKMLAWLHCNVLALVFVRGCRLEMSMDDGPWEVVVRSLWT